MSAARRVVPVVAGVIVSIAAVVFVWSAVTTSTARVSASTESGGFLSAGTVDLVSPTSSQSLLFDQDGLYPGAVLEGCVEVRYDGSIPGSVRLFARPAGGSGLDRYVNLTLERSTDPAGCDGFTAGEEIYQGLLSDFWAVHTGYGSGLELADVEQGSRLALRATAELVDDNDAQGLSFDFDMVVEVRP